MRRTAIFLMILTGGALLAQDSLPPRMRDFAAVIQPRDGWRTAPEGDDLISGGLWDCASGCYTENGKLKNFVDESRFAGCVNTMGLKLNVSGDFSVAAVVTVKDWSTYAALLFVGQPKTGTDWWDGLKRVEVWPRADGVSVSVRDGLQQSPVEQQWLAAPGTGQRPRIEMARAGGQIAVYVNGVEAGRLGGHGVFDSGVVELGMSVAAKNQLTVHALAALTPNATPENVQVQRTVIRLFDPVPSQGDTLRSLATAHGILTGSVVLPPPLLEDRQYRETLGREYGSATTGFPGLYFNSVAPAEGRYTFCATDVVVAFAEHQGLEVNGHPLVWHTNLPQWIQDRQWSRDRAIEFLRQHIFRVMRRYQGRVRNWIVLNEGIGSSGEIRQDSPWFQAIGAEYIDMIFRWAREADPGARLIYNDFQAEDLGAKSDGVYNLINGMKQRGVPVDIVGLQAHLHQYERQGGLNPADLIANMRRLVALGVEVWITELDDGIPLPASQADLTAQAGRYRSVLDACLQVSGCTGFITWGFTDRYSWIPSHKPGYGVALPFDENYQPKPAYDAMIDLLNGQ